MAEKLGSCIAQLLSFNPVQIEVFYRGDLVDASHEFIRLGLMKGYLTYIKDKYVSYVNAEEEFVGTGLKIKEKNDVSFQSYKSALKIKVSNTTGDCISVGGVVFDQRFIKLSLINDFYFETSPSGHMLVIENEDKPGVIGMIGTILGEKGINIDSFDLSRSEKGKSAMALIKLDKVITAETMNILKKTKHIKNVSSLSL